MAIGGQIHFHALGAHTNCWSLSFSCFWLHNFLSMPSTCRTCYIEICKGGFQDVGPAKSMVQIANLTNIESSPQSTHSGGLLSLSPFYTSKSAFLFSAALKPTELTQSQSPFIRIAQRAAWKKHCEVDILAITYRADSSQLLAASLHDASPYRRKVSCKQIRDSYSVRASTWKLQFTHVLGQCEYVLIESTEACCIATCIILEIWNSIDCRAADFVRWRKTSQEGPWKIFSDSSITFTQLVWARH